MAIELTTATTQQLSGIRSSLQIPLLSEVYPEATLRFIGNSPGSTGIQIGTFGSIVDFAPLARCQTVGIQSVSNYKNANELTNLKNIGTTAALDLASFCQFSEATLNQLFTDLPATNQTATIDVRNNPGAATCNTSIATNKGYTVITS